MKRIGVILLLFILSSCSSSKTDAIQVPADDKQRAFTINVNITAEVLYIAYMSTDVQQRRLAEMYVAGVLDATEGVVWCGFDIASPNAIQEQVFSGLKSIIKTTPNLRASKAITNKLRKLVPCKEHK